MIKGAIFDVDGTLLDSMNIWDVAASRLLASMGITADADLPKIVAEMSMEEACIYMIDRYSLSETVPELKAGILDTVEDFYINEVRAKPGVSNVLECLRSRGIPCCIATSCDKTLASRALDRLGLLRYFTAIFTSSDLNTSKREPLIYLRAAEHLGLSPAEICVFEDALHAVKTAVSAGFYTVAVFDPSQEEHRNELIKTSDRYIESFESFSAERKLL